MHSDQFEQQRSHGSPERIPGAFVRDLAQVALKKGLFPSKEALAVRLSQELQSIGIGYHIRTLKRQISGCIATVPPEVGAMSRLLFNGNGRRPLEDVRQLFSEPAISELIVKQPPAYVLAKRVLPLVHLWLHLNPNACKRALATRLQRSLEEQGVTYTVDSLNAILAGKNRLLIRAAIGDTFLKYLREFGIGSRPEAEARIQALAEDVRRSLAGRRFVPSRRFHELCLLWLLRHRDASARQLSNLLRQKMLERGFRMSLVHIENVVAGETRWVRRLLETALEDLLGQEFPQHANLDAALARTSRQRERYQQDMGWVRAEPIVALANAWLQQHPGMTLRQLAIRLSDTIGRMGYSRSPDTIQPILGGWKKKARRFLHRAMVLECGATTRCRTKGCVYPAVRDGLCRLCCLREHEPHHFERPGWTACDPAILLSPGR